MVVSRSPFSGIYFPVPFGSLEATTLDFFSDCQPAWGSQRDCAHGRTWWSVVAGIAAGSGRSRLGAVGRGSSVVSGSGRSSVGSGRSSVGRWRSDVAARSGSRADQQVQNRVIRRRQTNLDRSLPAAPPNLSAPRSVWGVSKSQVRASVLSQQWQRPTSQTITYCLC